MILLAVDTSTRFLSIGIFDGVKTYEYNVAFGTKHSSLLIPVVESVLSAIGKCIRDVDYFACGLGPGSFTGIRVGVAAIKAMAWAGKKPIIGISTLDILAQSAKDKNTDIIAAIDAKRGLVYYAKYRIAKGMLKKKEGYSLITGSEFMQKVNSGYVILGDALELHKDAILKKCKKAGIMDRDYWYPKGHCIVEIALQKIKAGKLTDAFGVEPVYLYPKECQIR